jgi:hypothetical protein
MDEILLVYTTAAVILLYLFFQVARGRFDSFAPIWMFLVGYVHIYVIQALSYHDWAVGVRGKDLVWAANFRALWALLWFLTVYHLPAGKLIAGLLPGPPRSWSPKVVAAISPPLIIWGLFCAGLLIRSGAQEEDGVATGESLVRSFPFVMLVAAILLIVTGRTIHSRSPSFLPAGLLVGILYVFIWMFNGKRSHSLVGVLATVCALYVSRMKRPSWPVLIATGFTGALVVALAIGWRDNMKYERSLAGFTHYIGDFKASRILDSLNITDEDPDATITYETVEYGGFLLMLDTVPEKSGYDGGASYLRVFSTFIPRMVWPTKPIYGRTYWVNAWIAGSEMERDETFAGPAIGILGATQLNGGTPGTLIVLGCLALLFSTSYAYFRLYEDVPWAQFWWAITYYNAWFTVVNDDPLIWFYYNWGLTAFPIVIFMWWASKGGPAVVRHDPGISTAV